ncbi:TraR/DksA C4-type zinc finger protein [Psychrobacter sp. HD31]|uniref:TraR/DksA C4-type zinc finger protein n=1 Tax=Psychrobacter sp. HD31 TaxID=3112003 RepID=UPI003DA58496
MDAVDIAQRQQELLLAKQLEQHKASQTNKHLANNQTCDGDYECIDCGELVEPQRVKHGLTLRCIACQHKHEDKPCKKL